MFLTAIKIGAGLAVGYNIGKRLNVAIDTLAVITLNEAAAHNNSVRDFLDTHQNLNA